LPVTVDIATLGNLQDLKVSLEEEPIDTAPRSDTGSSTSPAKTVTPAPATAPAASEGLGGLINSYQKMNHGE
jgi:hypothetical protein